MANTIITVASLKSTHLRALWNLTLIPATGMVVRFREAVGRTFTDDLITRAAFVVA